MGVIFVNVLYLRWVTEIVYIFLYDALRGGLLSQKNGIEIERIKKDIFKTQSGVA